MRFRQLYNKHILYDEYLSCEFANFYDIRRITFDWEFNFMMT